MGNQLKNKTLKWLTQTQLKPLLRINNGLVDKVQLLLIRKHSRLLPLLTSQLNHTHSLSLGSVSYQSSLMPSETHGQLVELLPVAKVEKEERREERKKKRRLRRKPMMMIWIFSVTTMKMLLLLPLLPPLLLKLVRRRRRLSLLCLLLCLKLNHLMIQLTLMILLNLSLQTFFKMVFSGKLNIKRSQLLSVSSNLSLVSPLRMKKSQLIMLSRELKKLKIEFNQSKLLLSTRSENTNAHFIMDS